MLKIVRGLGGGLDIQALVAVANWEFDPALMAGKPVAPSLELKSSSSWVEDCDKSRHHTARPDHGFLAVAKSR